MKTKYRIKEVTTYDLSCPVIYSVQRSEQGFFNEKWVNIKSFDRKDKAKKLLRVFK